jgi:CRP-like cAMP-binding protein
VRLRKDAKIRLLRRVPLFSGCSDRELAEIAFVADELDLPEGRTLMRQGERGREFVIVAEGSVEVRRNGRKLPARGGTDFFGEIALLSDAPRTATVTTASPVRLLVLTDRAFQRVLKGSPPIQRKILRAMADRLAQDTI